MSNISVVANVDGNICTLQNAGKNTFKRNVASPLKTSNILIYATDEAGNIAYDDSQSIEVIGEWESPKINWSGEWNGENYIGDYFTYVDYNRIINNLMFLAGYASQMYKVISIENLNEKKEADLIYADEVNEIENGLEYINNLTYMLPFSKKVWKENRNVPTADDWNRIEKLQLDLYNSLISQKEAQHRLAFDMGSQKGFKV